MEPILTEEILKEHRFRWNELVPYLKSLGEEIWETRRQFVGCLEAIKENPKTVVKINEKILTIEEVLKVALVIIKNQSSNRIFSDYGWLLNGDGPFVKYSFEELEEYLGQIPGANIPEKNFEVKKWFDKTESVSQEFVDSRKKFKELIWKIEKEKKQ